MSPDIFMSPQGVFALLYLVLFATCEESTEGINTSGFSVYSMIGLTWIGHGATGPLGHWFLLKASTETGLFLRRFEFSCDFRGFRTFLLVNIGIELLSWLIEGRSYG